MRLYILLDTSGSMAGAKIAALNDAMSNIVSELRQISNSTKQGIELAIFSFGKDAKWMYEQRMDVKDFSWSPLLAGGMTPLGKACLQLNRDLMPDNTKPADKIFIILISDGCPTDDYDEGIATLWANPRFKKANRFAIAIGDNADIPALLRFVDSDSHIFVQNRADELMDTLQNLLCKVKAATPIKHSAKVEIEEDDEWA